MPSAEHEQLGEARAGPSGADLAQLDTWLRHAGTATTIDDVIRG
jgi:hypothetical protein